MGMEDMQHIVWIRFLKRLEFLLSARICRGRSKSMPTICAFGRPQFDQNPLFHQINPIKHTFSYLILSILQNSKFFPHFSAVSIFF